MKKKIFFVAGLAVSALAASCFIPLADGNYWWSAWNEPHVTVVDFVDRAPAGEDIGKPIEPGDEDYTVIDDEPVEKPTKKPKPAPIQSGNCIEESFTEDKEGKCEGCIRPVSFSSHYVNSYLTAAAQSPYRLRGKSQKRLAIMGILTAGYCRLISKYQHGYEGVIPKLDGSWQDHNLQDRVRSWRNNNQSNDLFCKTDAFDEIRVKACEKIYERCNLWEFKDKDCYGATPDSSSGGGSSNGGSTTGTPEPQREVGSGTNQGSGHGANQGGGHGEGPPGSER